MKPLFEIISSSSKQQGLQNHSHLSQAMQALFLGQEQPSSTCFFAQRETSRAALLNRQGSHSTSHGTVLCFGIHSLLAAYW